MESTSQRWNGAKSLIPHIIGDFEKLVDKILFHKKQIRSGFVLCQIKLGKTALRRLLSLRALARSCRLFSQSSIFPNR